MTVPGEACTWVFPESLDWPYLMYAIGYTGIIPYLCLAWSSLQWTMLCLLLKKPNTYYVTAASLGFCFGGIHHGVHRYSNFKFMCLFPSYIVTFLFCPLLAMADAWPQRSRKILLRFVAPAVCIILLTTAVSLRLPSARESEGYRVIWSMGAETVSNMDIKAKSVVVLLLLTFRGVWASWRRPDRLAFWTSAIVVEKIADRDHSTARSAKT